MIIRGDLQEDMFTLLLFFFFAVGKVSKRSLTLNILHNRFLHGEAVLFNFHILQTLITK